MKTRRIFTASTAALLGMASVAVSANAAAVDVEYDEDGINIGTGVLAFINEKDEDKFEDYTLEATEHTVADDSADPALVDVENDSVIKNLSKSLKKELAKMEAADVKIWDIDLANGIYSEEKSPAAVKITITIGFDAKVYHVDGERAALIKSTSRQLADGSGYEISFTTTSFSPFIFTASELKNAGTAVNDSTSDTSDTSDTSNSSSVGNVNSANVETGIALAIAPVVLAASAVAVVALKKKR